MMKRLKSMIYLACAAVLLGSITTANAETVTPETARLVAENYARLTIVRDGTWGLFDEARVHSVEPFRGTTRDLGWFCHVEPTGYILVAMYVDMMPVHAYSNRSDFDPSESGGMAAFFRAKLEGKYTAIEAKLGRAIAPTDDLRPILERSYRDSWSALADPAFDPTSYRQVRKNRSAGMDYQEGETMLLSTWDQSPPYNDDCPDRGCSWETFDHFNANGWAGCVATAMAQMLRHHNWPPAGANAPEYEDPYDWPNMLNKYVYDGAGWFTDENGTLVTQAQIDAVAEISREMGMSVSMDYGCSGSSAYMEDCEEAMETHFFIHDGCQVLDRSDYTFDRWYELYQAEFDANRPAGIGIPDHMVVGDGWRIENIGGVDWRQIHVVYGWNGTHDAWYSPDDITGDPDDTMLRGVRPNCVLNSNPSGTYTTDGNTWRYFNRDVYTDGAVFEQGHWLQILMPGFLITNTGTTPTDKIEFRGGAAGNTRLFMNGDPGGERRMLMIDGTFRINSGGQVAFY
jgi:hypothetical protein